MALHLLVFRAQILELSVKIVHPGPQVTEGDVVRVVAHLQHGVMVRFERLQLRLMFILESRQFILVPLIEVVDDAIGLIVRGIACLRVENKALRQDRSS